jgi:protein-tyrosine phosphatase
MMEHLAATRNFRDAGQFVSASLSGKIFRMGKLHKLSEPERSYLEQLKLTHVLDLRSESERRAEPDTPISARFHHIDFSGGLLGLDQVLDLYRKAAADPGSVDAEGYIQESYRRIPVVCTDEVRCAIDAIVAVHEPRILIHCAGGKDRTGFLTALLLKLGGASDEQVIGEYLLSRKSDQELAGMLDRYLKRFAAHGLSVPAEVARPFLTVDELSMRALLDMINSEFGGVVPYLTDAASVPEKHIDYLVKWLDKPLHM